MFFLKLKELSSKKMIFLFVSCPILYMIITCSKCKIMIKICNKNTLETYIMKNGSNYMLFKIA